MRLRAAAVEGEREVEVVEEADTLGLLAHASQRHANVLDAHSENALSVSLEPGKYSTQLGSLAC